MTNLRPLALDQHAILKPFMLRRVKKDVITEMTNKKELMVPCLLSKRQQAFYQAIKNKISVADLFDSKGAMNEKKVLNLMNIVIQLRKVRLENLLMSCGLAFCFLPIMLNHIS